MAPAALPWRRLILWRPRPEFPLPVGWAERAWIPLGELRPLLQAVSPVRDLSDLWRWVAQPIPREAVEQALTGVASLEDPSQRLVPDRSTAILTVRIGGTVLRAVMILTGPSSSVERVELDPMEAAWFAEPASEVKAAMLAIGSAFRETLGCVVVGV